MHSRFSKRGALIGGLLALVLAVMLPAVASAVPEAGAKQRGFRLFARSLGAITVNRIYCGLATTGEVCVDSNNSSTIGGGFWPKGTADQYVFNSGLQVAGIIDPAAGAGNPWSGDTTGGFFFDPKGTTQHGLQVEPIYNSQNPEDFAAWPEAANVPFGDAVGDLYFPLLQGRKSASQGDVWWISWEGNPGQASGRPHPLGIAVEQRGMGWNYPTGNEDIIYFTYTFYNITSLNEADYAAIRPGMREIMIARANDFHALNNAAFGIDLPDEGYTITDMYAAFGADMDVGDAGENYATVQLPFALGNTYTAAFDQPAGWTFDPGIFAPPFFKGVGFVGVKYLSSPTGAGEINLFSNTINGGSFGDARNTTQLWRYLSGNISPAAGDAPCEQGPPQVTKLCYINNGDRDDMRFFQSSTALELGPGEFGTIVVAYIFAPPVAVTSFVPGGDQKPGDPLRFASPTQLASIGANMVDSLAGFLDYTDGNSDGIAQQDEYVVVPGSLLGKALVAQSVFDNKFLLPFAPEAPEFFLVPGDDQVSVLWRPSASEATGDAFFNIASQATETPPGGGAEVPNALYDPNYRQRDVEGYRVYRGRVDAPNSLTLLAQFDYAGTVINDFTGSINPVNTCSPDLGIFTDCPAAYDPLEFAPGVARTVSYEVPLVATDGPIIQVKSGGRTVLADSTAFVLIADTAVTGLASGFPALSDNGVPFIYVDQAVRNNFRYFYSVTAFDVNSFASGPSSLESPRITRSVTPGVSATNAQYDITTSTSVWGRGEELTDNALPTIDPATGVFSKAFPPANGWSAEFSGYVQQIVSGPGAVVVRLDSLHLGSAYNNVPGVYFLTINPGQPSEAHVSFNLAMANTGGNTQSTTVNFAGAAVNPVQAANFGVDGDFVLGAAITAEMPADYWTTVQSRGCVNSAEGFTNADGANECSYNGSRWFDGDVETAAHPTAGNLEVNDFGFPEGDIASYNNAGTLAGVTTIYEAHSYTTTQTTWRNVEAIIGFAARAADIKVYWGGGGVVDSVIDVTHNVVVPFDTAAGGSWGFVDPAAPSTDARPAVASLFDFGCVYPINQFSTLINCGGQTNLKPVATLDQVIVVGGSPMSAQAARAPQPNPGFVMYIAGHVYTFEMASLPADGTVWTMRGYTGGGLTGGQGSAGDEGPYVYNEVRPRPFTAVGAEVHLDFDATNVAGLPTLADLDRVHTVPDPYYVTNEFEQTTDNKVLQFVNLPNAATIRIYSSSGILVQVIEHNTANADGTATWNLLNRNDQVVASGVYFYHIEAGDARRVGRFTVVNFAQ